MKILHIESFDHLRTLTENFLHKAFPGSEVHSVATEEEYFRKEGDLLKVPFSIGLISVNLLWWKRNEERPTAPNQPKEVRDEHDGVPMPPRVGGIRCLNSFQAGRAVAGLPPLPYFFFDVPSERQRESQKIEEDQIVRSFIEGQFQGAALENKIREVLALQIAA